MDLRLGVWLRVLSNVFKALGFTLAPWRGWGMGWGGGIKTVNRQKYDFTKQGFSP